MYVRWAYSTEIRKQFHLCQSYLLDMTVEMIHRRMHVLYPRPLLPLTVVPLCTDVCVCDCLLSMHRQLETNMDDKSLAKELDQWISSLQECKQLEEGHVKILCDKVCSLLLQVHTLCMYLICAGFRMTMIIQCTCCVYMYMYMC